MALAATALIAVLSIRTYHEKLNEAQAQLDELREYTLEPQDVGESEHAYYSDMYRSAPEAAENYKKRVEQFAMFSKAPVDVVFFGDSITEQMPLEEMFTCRVANRGIGGDTVKGVLARVDQLESLQPKKLFLMIGINSIGAAVANKGGLAEQYMILFDELTQRLPDTEIFVESVLLTDCARRPDLDNDKVVAVNKLLEILCKRYGMTFLNINPEFTDETGSMIPEYSVDGLHLSLLGMAHWRELLRPWVEGGPSAKQPDKTETIPVQAALTKQASIDFLERFSVGKDTQAIQLMFIADGRFSNWPYVAQIRHNKVIRIVEAVPLSYPTDTTWDKPSAGLAILFRDELDQGDQFRLCKMGEQQNELVLSQAIWTVGSD